MGVSHQPLVRLVDDSALRGVPEPGSRPSDRSDVIVSMLRALLRAGSRLEAADVLQSAVGDLGGTLVPVPEALGSDLPVDVSLGAGEPLVVRLPDDPAAAQFLAAHLASIVEDAAVAAVRSDRHARQAERASTDTLTKVASRAEIGPRLGRSVPGDAIAVLDLDHFKLLNDTSGHEAGDTALRAFGALLLGEVRGDDFVGRLGGDEFVVLLQDVSPDIACTRMRVLADTWLSSGGLGASVSVGVAAVDERGGAIALARADKALYRAKQSGRDRVEQARPDDDGDAAL